MLASASRTQLSLSSRVAVNSTGVSRCRAAPRSVTTMASFHDFTAKDINGKDVQLSSFKGKVVLMTNVASACGYTASNYKELVALHDKYKDKGLEVIAWPCNQFGKQESGSADAICKFTTDKGVKFPVMEKIDVNGPNTHPVWKWAKEQTKTGDVSWNFAAKFIIDKDGNVVERNSDSPMASEKKIQALL